MSDPMSYWEQRSNLNEKILEQLMRICIRGLPQSAAQDVVDLGEAWNRAIDDLDREHHVSST